MLFQSIHLVHCKEHRRNTTITTVEHLSELTHSHVSVIQAALVRCQIFGSYQHQTLAGSSARHPSVMNVSQASHWALTINLGDIWPIASD